MKESGICFRMQIFLISRQNEQLRVVNLKHFLEILLWYVLQFRAMEYQGIQDSNLLIQGM
jgi:hypothetical protein